MKKIIAIVLTMTMLLTLVLATSAYAVNLTEAENQASALKMLGLFKGVSDTDFDLNRTPTRTEALIMLIRLLGKEPEALNGNWSHPFSDVTSWADKYVGYAYEKGLTKGITATEFGKDNATSEMYLTFVLRALGYSDASGDFVWSDSDTFAKSVGILPESVDTSNFMRADAVLVSWSALEAKLKEENSTGSRTLYENLMAVGVIKLEDYRSAKQVASGNKENTKEGEANVSTFEELQRAVENKKISVININSDINITSKFSFERDADLIINIIKEKTLTIDKEFIPIGCSITNNGDIIINDNFDRGLCSLINNGDVKVKSGGVASSGVSNTDNNGTFIVEEGAKLLIERGTQFNNLGTLTNNGYISINDGGSLSNERGLITNNGIIDLYTYFNGKTEDIKGTGKLNDKRN